MKWIGQHIFDFISRFKSEVYYDGVPDGTIEAAKHLGLDANNRLVKAGTGVAQSPNTVIKMYIKDDDGSTATFDHGRYIKMVPTSAMSIDWDLTNAGSIDHVGNDADPHLLNFSLTPRTFITNLEGQTAATYDGTGNASLGVTGVLKTAHGGTGQNSFADKSIVITQTSGTTALSGLPLTTAGGLVVGGSGGPQVATLTAGSNVTITNSDNSITVASANDNTFRTIKVDTNNDGIAAQTIGASEDLKLVGGNDITLSESSGTVTITSTASGSGGGGGSIDGLDDVDTSTDSPSINEVLKWNGEDWVPAGVNESFSFAWNSVVYTPSYTDTTPTGSTNSGIYVAYSSVLIGSGNHSTSAAVTHNFSNAVSNKFTSGANGSDNLGLQTRPYGQNSYTARANLNFSNNTASASHTINYPYPTDLDSGRYAYTKTKFTYDGTAYTHFIRYSYQNYAYLGKHTDDSPTNTELQDFQKKQLIASGTSANGSIQQSITLNSTSQHLQLWIPDRITDDPTFEVGPNANSLLPETWTKIVNGDGSTFILNHENVSGFSEDYRGYKSPNPLNNSSLSTWYVKAIY